LTALYLKINFLDDCLYSNLTTGIQIILKHAVTILLAASYLFAFPLAGSSLPANPVRIAEIVVRGKDRVSEEVILEKFGLKAGEEYSKARGREGMRRIRTLSAVERARLWELPDRRSGGIKLVIIIDYRRTLRIRPAVTRDYSGDLALGMELSEKNLRSRDEELEILALVRGANVLETSFYDPDPAVPFLDGLGAGFSYKDYSYPYPQCREDLIDERIRRLEPELSFHFSLLEKTSLILSPGVDKVFGDGSLIREDGQAEGLPPFPSGLFTTFRISLSAETVAAGIYPTSGFRVEFSRKDWGILDRGSEIESHIYEIKAAALFRFGRPLFQLRFRSSMSGSQVPLLLMQHLGGENTIRGYEYGIFTGVSSFLAKLDIRIPLNFYDRENMHKKLIPVEFGLFVDTGTCWSKREPVSLNGFHSGFGGSLNFILPTDIMLRTGGMWTLESSAKFYLDVEKLF